MNIRRKVGNSTLALRNLVPNGSPFNAVLPRVAELKDKTLISVARCAYSISTRAFILNGACFFELCSRIQRLKGGYKKRDTERVGAQFQMQKIANEIGFDVRTLRMNARIYEIFYLPPVKEGTLLERERSFPSLPREFYVTALAAPDSIAAIEIALARRAVGHYSCQQFRLEVRSLKERSKTSATAENNSESRFRSFYLRLPPEASAILEAKMETTQKDASEVIAELLLRLRMSPRIAKHKTSSARPSRKPTKASSASQTKAEAPSAVRSLFDLSNEQEVR